MNLSLHTACGFALALCLAQPLQAAGTKIDKVDDRNACFYQPDANATKIGCVKVGTARGTLGEGLQAGSSTWVVEVRDDKGKVIDDVGKGGEIIVLSTQAYAKRERGKQTFSIHRLDGAGKPLKTDFVWIQNQVENLENNSAEFSSFAGTTFGMTAPPPKNTFGRYQFRSDLRGEMLAGGIITGIAADGTLGPGYPDAVAVQAYGDFSIITFAGGLEHQVADEALRPVSPRIATLEAFVPALREDRSDGRDHKFDLPYPRVMYAVAGRRINAWTRMYNLLPRSRTAPRPPPDLLGMIPLQVSKNLLARPYAMPDERVHRQVIGWAAAWASDAGPQVSLLDYTGQPVSDERFRSVNWWGGPYFDGAVLERMDGTARVAYAQPGGWLSVVYTVSPEVHPSAAAASKVITGTNQAKFDAYRRELAERQAQYEREQQMRARAAAEQVRLEAELRIREAQEAAEELALARQMAATATSHYDICRAAERMKYVASAAVVQAKCSELYRAAEPRQKRDFWGDLAAALDAWSAAAKGTSVSGGATPPPGASPDWDFARQQKAIDNSMRVITDPNWNGAASRAVR